MSSVSLHGLFGQARSAVSDLEDSRFGDLDSMMADSIRCLLEQMAVSEVEHRVGAKLYERSGSRQAHRNGYRSRRAQVSFTTVTVRIPRIREEGYVPTFLERNQRAVSVVERWIERAFLCGVNRAEIIRLMESTTGCRPSEGVLRRVQGHLDEQVRQFQQRPLTEPYIYLFVDAAWVKDIVGLGARRICVLCALGVTASGKREILGFVREPRECAAGWSRFLGSLLSRGLDRSALKLVISDEHAGIKSAVLEQLGDVAHQYCWAHRCRNIFEAVRKADRNQMVLDLRRVYQAEHQTGARAALRSLCARWEQLYPAIVAELNKDAGNLLAFYDAPPLHWEYVRTSNPVERPFLELRRSRFGCGAFANRQACDRVVGNTFIRLNRLWEGTDIWMERRRRIERRQATEREQAAAVNDRPAHPTDPVSGARVAPQQSPILPDGYGADCTLVRS